MYFNSYTNEYVGAVVIPTSVAYKGKSYNVTSIGRYAFYDCNRLTAITCEATIPPICKDDLFDSGLTEIFLCMSRLKVSMLIKQHIRGVSLSRLLESQRVTNNHIFVQASGISLRATLTNLDAGTVYKYRVYGKVGDKTLYGTEMTFTTQSTYEEPVVTDLESINDNNADGDVRAPNGDTLRVRKVFENGQIYVLLPDGRRYNMQGMEVK